MYVCMYRYVCMYVCTYVCVSVCMYVYMYVCMYTCVYVFLSCKNTFGVKKAWPNKVELYLKVKHVLIGDRSGPIMPEKNTLQIW